MIFGFLGLVNGGDRCVRKSGCEERGFVSFDELGSIRVEGFRGYLGYSGLVF